MEVDHLGMFVIEWRVHMRIKVWFRAFPYFGISENSLYKCRKQLGERPLGAGRKPNSRKDLTLVLPSEGKFSNNC